jgi:hypothetical protein
MKQSVYERTRLVGGLVFLALWIGSRIFEGPSMPQIDSVVMLSAVVMLASDSSSVSAFRNKALAITALLCIAICLILSVKENLPEGLINVLPPVQQATYLVGCMTLLAWKAKD